MGGSLATVLTGDVGDGCGGWRMGAGDLGVSAFRGMRRGRGLAWIYGERVEGVEGIGRMRRTRGAMLAQSERKIIYIHMYSGPVSHRAG